MFFYVFYFFIFLSIHGCAEFKGDYKVFFPEPFIDTMDKVVPGCIKNKNKVLLQWIQDKQFQKAATIITDKRLLQLARRQIVWGGVTAASGLGLYFLVSLSSGLIAKKENIRSVLRGFGAIDFLAVCFFERGFYNRYKEYNSEYINMDKRNNIMNKTYTALDANKNEPPSKKIFKDTMVLPENWSEVLLKNNPWIAKELGDQDNEHWSCDKDEVLGYFYKYAYDLIYFLYFGQNPEKYMMIKENNTFVVEADKMVKLSWDEYEIMFNRLVIIKGNGEITLDLNGDEFDVYPFYRKIDKGVDFIIMSITRIINQGRNTITMLVG
jgi:hypothetical protein